MNFRSDNSQGQQKLESTTKIQLAKRQLNSIEEKFKAFKSKSREHSGRHSQDSHVPYDRKSNYYNTNQVEQHPFMPDLKQYFSFMMEKQNQSLLNNQSSKIISGSKINRLEKSPNKYELNEKGYEENFQKEKNRSIEQKIMQQKSQAINSLQNFFMTKKQQLEAKISQLQQQKQKAIQDINLLKRNNSEIQSQIQVQKNMIFTDTTQTLKEKNREIQEKILKKKQTIETMKKDVQKVKLRKDQLKQNIQECLKGNKNLVMHDKLCQ